MLAILNFRSGFPALLSARKFRSMLDSKLAEYWGHWLGSIKLLSKCVLTEYVRRRAYNEG